MTRFVLLIDEADDFSKGKRPWSLFHGFWGWVGVKLPGWIKI